MVANQPANDSAASNVEGETPIPEEVSDRMAASTARTDGDLGFEPEYKRLLAERDRLLAEVESERKRLAAILKTLPAGVIIGEAPAGGIVLVNDAAVRYLGDWVRHLPTLSEGGAYRMQGREGRVLEAENYPLARARRGESFVGEEIVITRPDGVRGVFSVSGTPLRDATGTITAGVVTFADMTERMRAQAALTASEHNYRALFEQAAVGIEQAGLDGRLIAVNDRLCAMLGYSREELLAKRFEDITDAADLPRERRRHKRLTSGKTDSYAFEKRYMRRNGTRLWARVTSSLARDDKGAVLYRISIIEDVSERRRAQTELRESEARYRATFEQAAIGIAHVALDGRWLSVNEQICAITGYSREELLRSRFQDITHPDDLDRNLALVAGLLRGDRDNLTMEKRYLRKDGAIVWARVTAALVRDGNGRPAYLISAIEDITEDLRAALTDARLAAIIRSSPDAIYSFDQDDVIGGWNSGAERLFGYEADEVIGRTHALLVPDDRKEQAWEAVARVKSGEVVVSFESERRRKDGTVFPCMVTKSPIHGAGGELLGFSSIVRDITERRQWEERQRLMARELIHRVKNSFAVIQSIVRQTQRSTPDPEAFAQAFGGRLAAMASAHDLLTDRHWEGAGLRELVAGQLAPFAAGAEKRVQIEGPEVTLDTSLAVPLGLALHELATNASKYGALSKPSGRIDLSWKVEGVGNAQQLTLVWQERGGPPVAPPQRRGFGSSLIERGLPDARIERRFEREGLICRIELPTSGVRLEGS
jgi:PAS domain S-box-containing protein